jgi:hypothetical protein
MYLVESIIIAIVFRLRCTGQGPRLYLIFGLTGCASVAPGGLGIRCQNAYAKARDDAAS